MTNLIKNQSTKNNEHIKSNQFPHWYRLFDQFQINADLTVDELLPYTWQYYSLEEKIMSLSQVPLTILYKSLDSFPSYLFQEMFDLCCSCSKHSYGTFSSKSFSMTMLGLSLQSWIDLALEKLFKRNENVTGFEFIWSNVNQINLKEMTDGLKEVFDFCEWADWEDPFDVDQWKEWFSIDILCSSKRKTVQIRKKNGLSYLFLFQCVDKVLHC